MIPLEFNTTCGCKVPRRPPIRIDAYVAAILRDHLSPDQFLMTWRCKGCKTKVRIHVKDIAPG